MNSHDTQTEHTSALPPSQVRGRDQATSSGLVKSEGPCLSEKLSCEKTRNIHEVATPSAYQLPNADSSLMPSVPLLSGGPCSSGEAEDVSWKRLISILSKSGVEEYMKVDSRCLFEDIMQYTMKVVHNCNDINTLYSLLCMNDNSVFSYCRILIERMLCICWKVKENVVNSNWRTT